MIDWTVELPKIEEAARKYQLDASFIRAIRHTENGNSGTVELDAIWELNEPSSAIAETQHNGHTNSIVLLSMPESDMLFGNVSIKLPNTPETVISIGQGQKLGDKLTLQMLLPQRSVDIKNVNNDLWCGFSFEPMENVQGVDIKTILQHFISTTKTQVPSSLKSKNLDASRIKMLMPSSLKLTNAYYCVPIVMPQSIIQSLSQKILQKSMLGLICSERETWFVAFHFSGGREFGVLSESAPTYDDQLRICCLTVSHRLVSYPLNPFTRDHESKLMYSPKWIAYFASIWAPTSNADNDPDGLNKFWYQNCLKAYLDYRDA